jgi:signal transduction histidine kinase/CheY-like chemotaxis protein
MNTNPSSNETTQIEQDQTLFKQLPIILGINIPLVAALAWIYWPWVDHRWLLSWCAGMLLIMLLRFYVFYMIYKKLPKDKLAGFKLNVFAVNSALSGFMWGIAGILFFVPGKLEYQLIILLVLIIKGAGSVSSVTSYLPAFYAYFPASMLPVSTMFLLQNNVVSILLALTSLVYTVVLLIFGKSINKTLLESLRLRNENRQLLQETLEQKRQAEQANVAKSRFLAAASHDLRQPIYTLSLLNGVLEANVRDAKSAQVITQIGNTIETLRQLLDALLDISKLDAGVIEVNRKNINLDRLFQCLAGEFEPQADTKALRITWLVDNCAVYSDEILLQQVLRNLVANAIRYTNAGDIEITAKKSANRVRIQVADSGIGIPPSQQDAIFLEFYQVDNPQRDRRQGLGLGLAIVARVLKLLQSEIHLHSEPGKGSRFYFDLAPGKLSNKNTETNRGVISKQILNATVAIIEDDIEVAQALQLLLQNWGCNTLVSADGDGILDKIKNEDATPDIIISDLQLANGQNGLDVIERTRQFTGNNTPALIVTGNSDRKAVEQAKQRNITVLQKPVAPAKLRAYLHNTIQ